MSAEHFNQQPFPPEVRGYIARMEELMREPEYSHAATPVQVAIELQKAGYITSFADFETCLREMDSRVYLLAAPIDFYGDLYPVKYPVDRQSECPEYALCIALHPEQAAQMLVHFDVTAEENMNRLENTGVLTLPRE